MCYNGRNLSSLKMVAALTFLGLMSALSIDNHVSVIKNDCYERLALEQRLNPKDVYKTVKTNTLQECQMACTQEQEICRSFSYGIGVKGNTTCELGVNVIKETADLKPIGTRSDTEFDLYIKKLGCKLVVDKNKLEAAAENSAEVVHVNENLYLKPDSIVPESQTSYGKPQNNRPPDDIPRPIQSPVFTGEYHVQTLVSVRPQNEEIPSYGPSESSKPPPNDNNNERPNELIYGRPDERPPEYNVDRPTNKPADSSYGRPENRPPYNNNKPINRPDDDSSYSKPQSSPLYDNRPNNRPVESSSSYGRPPPHNDNRPSYGNSGGRPPIYDRPTFDRPDSRPPQYDDTKPVKEPAYIKPGTKPPALNDIRPIDKPYGRPPMNNPPAYNPDPPSYGRPPMYDNEIPAYNRPPAYDRPNNRPLLIDYDDERPIGMRPGGYGSGGPYGPRPDRPYGMGGMPNNLYDIPRPPSNYDDSDRPPFRPSYLNSPYDESRPPFRPRPDSDSIPRPMSERPQRPNFGYGESDPVRPERPVYNNRPVYDNRPIYDNRPPIYDNRPVYDNKPVQENRPVYDNRPSYDNSPVYDNRPAYDNRPIHDNRPAYNRPVHDNRPAYDNRPTYDNRPIHDNRPAYDNRPIHDNRPGYGNRPFDTNNPNSGGYDRPLIEGPGYDSRTRPQRPIEVNSNDPYTNKVKPQSDNGKPIYQQSKPKPDYDNPPKKPYETNVPNYDSSYEKPSSQDTSYNRPISSSTHKTTYVEILQTATESSGYNNPVSNYDKSSEKPRDPNNPNTQGGYNVQSTKPNKESYGGGSVSNKIPDSSYQKEPHMKPIVTQMAGPGGQTITSIITPLDDADDACFRRVLAGKRVARRFVKRALTCERIEDCQEECADEKRFVCEGFNYRLDPSGRSKGECELLDVPITHLDIGRDLYPDPDYDYYERDRNSPPDCKRRPSRPSFDGGYGGGNVYDNRYTGGYGNGYDNLGHHYSQHQGHGGSYNRRHDYYHGDGSYGGRRPPPPPPPSHDYGGRRPSFDGYYGDDRYMPYPDRQGDFYYQHSHHSQHEHENSQSYHFNYHNSDKNDHHEQHDYGHHYHDVPYLPNNNRYKPYHPPEQYDHKSYEPYLPPNRRYDVVPYNDRDRYNHEREKDRNYWGFDNHGGGWGSYGGLYGNFGSSVSHYGFDQPWHHRNQNRNNYDYSDYHKKNYYLPPQDNANKGWGQYGGSYGTGGHYYHDNQNNGYNYWGFKRKNNAHHDAGHYYEQAAPNYHHFGSSYLPINYDDTNRGYNGYNRNSYNNKDTSYNNAITPSYIGSNPTKHSWDEQNTYNFMRDECSLRSATGFRLHKGIVKKFRTVPNIFECELLCFKEREFKCNSYAFRYTISSNVPTDNCYLSNRNYKELDYYTDFEPDRDFDIYTMNNPNKCAQPTLINKDSSECFWRVRSGSRLEHKVVRESLNVKTVVECQIECLKSVRFTCRAFSFRYGSGVIGGALENCQLTDWPFHELDPNVHLVSEPGFELYERGSFGHGCEPNHFNIQFRHKDQKMRVDQLCYVGFGSPARLLPQATKKTLSVESELDCKAECSRHRQGTLFQCMSFSFRTAGPKSGINCYLSDILQRDLLANVDYIDDPDSWLFAWDNYNPECIALVDKHIPSNNNQKVPDKTHSVIESRLDQFDDLGIWSVYSVRGWPCKRGSFCKENREAGFWYCELEGGGKNAWDYCCRPNHQCGFSEEYPYQWCYVGPEKTQWRTCSDRYFPYVDNNSLDRNDDHVHYEQYPPEHKDTWAHVHRDDSYLPHSKPPATHYRPGERPDRPPAPPTQRPPRPSLDEYEMQFDDHFLDPPRPGGFGQPRRWPVSYLHKEMPPNETTLASSKFEEMNRMEIASNPRYNAIKSLIDIIKSNDLKNIQYQITNESNKADDILFVKIPLPSNFSHEVKNQTKFYGLSKLEPVDIEVNNNNVTKGQNRIDRSSHFNNVTLPVTQNAFVDTGVKSTPIYRRAFITKTNVTSHGQRARFRGTLK